jgi:predicted Holliday junction resolvase-like endonuclease
VLYVLYLREELLSIQFLKRSQSVKYGQLTEQWIPFSKKYPFNSQNFRFIGKPVDGLSFEDDKIVFVEFKTNKSQLNDSQKKIKSLVENKKIDWLELRID